MATSIPHEIIDALGEPEEGAGASGKAIAALRKAAPKVPQDYLDFLAAYDGCDTDLGDNALRIYPADRVLKYNADYGVPEKAPDLFLFGTDVADSAYLYDLGSSPPAIVKVTFLELKDRDAREQVASDLRELFEVLGE